MRLSAPHRLLRQSCGRLHIIGLSSARLFPHVYPVDDAVVGIVYACGVDGVEVDLGGAIRLVAHALADDGDGEVHIARNTCPRVSRHIGGERNLESRSHPDALQCPVDTLFPVAILLVLRAVGSGDDGQQIRRVAGEVGISVYDVLQRPVLRDGQVLVGFSSAVAQHAILQVCLAQESHIHKRHATHIEAEHKHIARQRLRGLS